MQKILNELNRMLDRAIAQDNHRDYEALKAAMACVMRAPTGPSQRDATDTDRLNFLIRTGAAVESLDGGWALHFGLGRWQDGEYDTPREAIDAAIYGGVSAQRVTQSQTLKASSGWLIDGGLLYRLNDEGANCDEINVTMAGGLRTEAARIERAEAILNMLKAIQKAADHIEHPPEMVAAPAEVVIDFERFGSAGPFAVVEGRVAIPVVTMLDLARMLKPTTDALAAAPVVLPEPDSYLFQHEHTGQTMFVEAQQVDWEFEANNPRLHKVYGLYTEQQVRELLAGVSAPAALAVERGEVLVTVSGFTGSGKSAIAGEIEIMCRALGLQVEWPDSDSEKHMTHADWIAALEQYKPRVRIVECNVPHSVVKGQDK